MAGLTSEPGFHLGSPPTEIWVIRKSTINLQCGHCQVDIVKLTLQGLLRHWVCAPLYDLDEIQQRQEAVEFFLHHGELAQQLRTSLKPRGKLRDRGG